MPQSIRQYTASNIKVLEGLDAVRKRPGMYIGNVEADGYHQLLYEIIDNSVDESFEGTCREIRVTLSEDGSATVEDDGRGIPVELNEDLQVPTAEVVLTKLHAGAKFDSEAYKFSGGLHGVGLSVVNALSEWVNVEICRDGKRYALRCENSIPVINSTTGSSVTVIGTSSISGTKIQFKPNLDFFHVSKFNQIRVQKRLEELSYLVPKVTFVLNAFGEETTYYSENGIESLLEKQAGGALRTRMSNITLSSTETRENAEDFDANFHLVFGLRDASSEMITSFANGIRTTDGGTHVSTYRTAFSRALQLFAKDRNLKINAAVIEEFRQDLIAVIEVKVSEPLFESQTKVKLKNFEFQRLFLKDLIAALRIEFTKDAEIYEKLLIEASEISRRKQRFKADLKKLKTKMDRQQQALPLKLADCSSRKFDSRELFIVEGDSAGGSLKQCKDDRTQAVLPLRGKTLNTERASFETQVLKNDALLSIVSALGLKFDEASSSKLRYSRIIIMTDADADGGHITILLLSFFYNYFPELFEQKRIFISVPPLYRIVLKKSIKYCVTDADMEAYLQELSAAQRKQAVVQRFKGLGEMNPEQLWETCVNPATRTLQLIDASDVEAVQKILAQTLGDSAEERKKFIRQNATQVDETFLFEL